MAQQRRSNHLRSFYYRHRQLLKVPCGKLDFEFLTLSQAQLNVAQSLIQCGSLVSEDFHEAEHKIALHSFRRLPKDPAFFKMLLEQNEIWIKFSDVELESFLRSPEADRWYQSRKRLDRPAYFELDMPFKPTPQKALSNEIQIKRLLRKHPLLRYSDLKSMGLKNAQKIIERFLPLEMHRRNYLNKLKSSLAS